MDFPTIVTISRKSRRKLRRRRILRVAFLVVSSLLVLWSFAAGVVWHRLKSKPSFSQAALAPVNEAQRAEALRRMDEAVGARHEERWEDATDAAAAARQADPGVKGSGILAAEVALRSGKLDALGRSLREASLAGENESSIKLLEAIDAWMRRNDRGVEHSAPQAKQLLAEAADIERSSGSPHFFRGELERMLGDSEGAYRSLLAALHRQAPWQSAALLDVKRHLAAREAEAVGRTVEAGEPGGQARAALAWVEATKTEPKQAGPAQTYLMARMPLLQFAVLARDVAVPAENRAEIRKMLSAALAEPLPKANSSD